MIMILLFNCSCRNIDPPQQSTWKASRDTTSLVHQPFAVYQLPIRTGVPIRNPSSLMMAPGDRLFGCNLSGEVFSLEDTDQDGLLDHAKLFCDVKAVGLRTPTSVAFRDGKIFVGTASEIRTYQDLDGDYVADTSFTFLADVPFSDHPYEYTSALTFDPDGNLYCALTTDSWNAGASPDPNKYRGAILRISPDGTRVERMAIGIRSVHGMAFNQDGDLFFVDNQGGQNPTEELNVLVENAFYGYYPTKYEAGLHAQAPILSLTTEVAPSQIQFHQESGQEYLYIAFYGPGEYWSRGGLAKIALDRDGQGDYVAEEIPLVTHLGKLSGLVINQRHEIYVSQVGKTDYWYYPIADQEGGIYQLIPDARINTKPFRKREITYVGDQVLELGEKLFAERACKACHAVDGKTELLGPNLKNVGQAYSRTELLEEIEYPSRRIKPGMSPTKITTVNNEVFFGRVVQQSSDEVQLMLVGNAIKTIPTTEIVKTELEAASMMYEGLLVDLDTSQVDALLDYLIAQSD